jgi:hypothetical protein
MGSAAGRTAQVTSVSVRSRCASTVRKVSCVKAVRAAVACLWLAVSTFAAVIVGGLLAIGAVRYCQVSFTGLSGGAARLTIAALGVLVLMTLEDAPLSWWRYHTRAARSGS